MKKSKKGAKLSFALTVIVAVALVICAIIAPFFLPWWYNNEGGNPNAAMPVMVSFYACCPMAAVAIYSLLKLLDNIIKDQIFIKQNSRLILSLSWCCFLVAVVTLVSTFFYSPFILVCAAASFISLILRVIKNVIESATEIKEENDLTI